MPRSGAALCYDFNARAEVPGCKGNNWDLKVTVSGDTASLWTNAGSSGTGAGGAFGGPFDNTWTALSAWKNATTHPLHGALPAAAFLTDSVGGVFAGTNNIASSVFEYDLTGDHRLFPTYRTFLITTNSASADTTGTDASPVFALQVTGYYGGAGGTTSGYPSIRYVDRRAPGVVHTATVNATSTKEWVYYDLVANAVSTAGGTWHIAFNRYKIRLNGGMSGTGTVAGFQAKTPAGFYDGDGKPVVASFTDARNPASTLADLTASDLALPTMASQWTKDIPLSVLNPKPTGAHPNPLNYGWYTFHHNAASAAANGLPALARIRGANPEGASLVRGGEGNTYARFHLTSIRYADPKSVYSQQTWTIDFDVQP